MFASVQGRILKLMSAIGESATSCLRPLRLYIAQNISEGAIVGSKAFNAK